METSINKVKVALFKNGNKLILSIQLIGLITAFLSFTSCKKDGSAVLPSTQPAHSATEVSVTPSDTSATFSFNPGNGVDLQPSYYNNGHVTFGWSLMKQYPEIKTVRIEIEPTVNIGLAESWIAAAISNGYQVIATYHKAEVLGSDNPDDLIAAANWWRTNYDSLATAGSFYINLMNEWGDHNLTANAYATAYNTAITIVRQVYNGPVIIDCPGWGQEAEVAAAAAEGTDGVKISDTDIVLSMHIYPNGWDQFENHSLQDSDLDNLASTDRPCIIGEFGNLPSGNTDWLGIVKHAISLGWAVIGWAWNGDGGSMNMVTPAWSVNPQAASYSTNNYFNIIDSLLLLRE